MTQAIATIRLAAPVCQSRYYVHEVPKKPKELSDDYEKRTWINRLHTIDPVKPSDDPGDRQIIIPGMAIANCLKEAAKFLSIQIPGKGKSTWTKHFESGVSVFDDIETGLKASECLYKTMFVHANGIKGSGTRVMRTFPLIPSGLVLPVTFEISNSMITPEVLAEHLQQAGVLIGIGSFRPRSGGSFGRFLVEKVEWISGGDRVPLPPIVETNIQSSFNSKEQGARK